MKIKWKAFPWVTVLLMLCAILVGVGFTFLLQVFLPSYKNTIVTVSDVPAINQMLYVEDTDQLIIYPWDQFPAQNGMTVEEFLTESAEDFPYREEIPRMAKELVGEIQDQLSGLMMTVQAPEGALDLESLNLDLESRLQVYQDQEGTASWLYLKEVPVRLRGYDCLLDAAWEGMVGRCVYFHVYKKEQDPLLDSTVESANRFLDQVIASNWTDPYPQVPSDWRVIDHPDGSVSSEAQGVEFDYDPLLGWLQSIHAYTGIDDADILTPLMRTAKFERIAYRDEILLVYSMDNRNRLVLFYDPMRNQVTGFSSNIV